MKTFLRLAQHGTLALAGLLSSQALAAQSSSVGGKGSFDVLFDCERPFLVRNHPIHAVLTTTLNADKSASADLAITGVLFTNRVHFDARLGAASQPAPGGTSSLRVIASNHLRATWDLPNNRLILDILTARRTCTANLKIELKPGMHEYTMFDGHIMYHCSKQSLVRSSCQPD